MRLFSSKTWVIPSFSPRRPRNVLAMSGLASLLDVDVDRGRQVDAHERVDRLRRRVEDVDEPLVRAHLEVLERVLVLVRRTDHRVHVLLRRQRHRADHTRSGLGDRLHDAPRRGVDRLVVIGLQPDADLLSRHRLSSLLPIGCESSSGSADPVTGGGRLAAAARRGTYLRILTTRPAPTVRPPSRMANRRPSSMAMGWISSTVISVLSPGMTISVPAGSVTTPVTSVVRK